MLPAGIAVALIIIIVAAIVIVSSPRPFISQTRDVGNDQDSSFAWDFTNTLQLFDVNGSPIMVRINPFIPGAVYVWDAGLGKEVELGSITLKLDFTLSGPESTLDWSSVHFQVTFYAEVWRESAKVNVGSQSVDGQKVGSTQKEISIVYLDSLGIFTGLGNYDYYFHFTFEYKATINKLSGGTIESDNYIKVLEFDFHNVPDGIVITGNPTVTGQT